MRQPDDYTETEATFIQMQNELTDQQQRIEQLVEALKIVHDMHIVMNTGYKQLPICNHVKQLLQKNQTGKGQK